MREILFRGKRKGNGEWIEGLTLQWGGDIDSQHEKHLFLTPNGYSFPLDIGPETVCQYTGLTDKNGRKVFEGDICEFSAYGESYKGDVRFINGNFTIWCGKCAPFLDDALEKHSAIVIGNIFDNPELMGE